MHLLSLSFSQSRHALFNSSRGPCIALCFRRHRSGGHSKHNKYSKTGRPRAENSAESRGHNSFQPFTRHSTKNDSFVRKPPQPSAKWLYTRHRIGPPVEDAPNIDPQNIPAFFESEVENWSKSHPVQGRLVSFGIPEDEVRPLLNAYVRAVQAGELSTPEGHETYSLNRFVDHLDDGEPVEAIDTLFTNIFFLWASDHSQTAALLSAGISPTTVTKIQALVRAGDLTFPADAYPMARTMHRKVIMHVGPTNSGKTHNALRALAAANCGVYAGPLRLLAHEIWERLNLGQIVPLGETEEPLPPTAVDTNTALDVGQVRKTGNPKFVRPCNMITGEEQRIVADWAKLTSCTVEMLNTQVLYDVAVIDEIQMIADAERGHGWTNAVLGASAKELHLCGEETAVPIVQALLKDTGDEIIINRYQRLSPLYLDEKSIDGDLRNVKKGDCIVTFSRGNLFAIKRKIEDFTDFRCAVVYGRLPPEIRSEQAALFNDPNSGYDIIIGSDAIGMGLNLKIGRIIFQATTKFDGKRDVDLSISSTKQIAGRAGRYGLHGSSNPGGYVTSFFPDSIPHIRKALDAQPIPLKTARVGISPESFQRFYLTLPVGAGTRTILGAHQYLARLPPYLRQARIKPAVKEGLCDFVDSRAEGMTVADRMLLIVAPIPLRDPPSLDLILAFLNAYRDTLHVDLWGTLADSPLLANMDAIESYMKEDDHTHVTPDAIGMLEALHRAVVFYVWMSFRRPLAFSCFEEVAMLKDRLEMVLDWGLQAVTRRKVDSDQHSWGSYVEAKKGRRRVEFKSHYGSRSHRTGISETSKSNEQPKVLQLAH
ncbi:hypothetical protein H0H92_012367 [Tricholoma furcatifolium]|nr:hypothetical protein H0H92_012367 [Tricholoma furcatifolium]